MEILPGLRGGENYAPIATMATTKPAHGGGVTAGFRFIWVVMEGPYDLSVNHDPRRLSLLYLCIDGVNAFQTLYVERGISLKAIAIIQPGEGFGGNYTWRVQQTK